MIYLQLFLSFLQIGALSFGGGYAAMPLIQAQIVTEHQWLSMSEFTDLVTIAEMTPGPIAVNAATFTGFRICGFAGALTATLAVVLPSLALLIPAAPFIDRISGNPHVQRIRRGIQLGVLSLILYAVWSYGSMAITGVAELLIALAAFAALLLTEKRLHPVVIVLLGGLAGLLLL